jgi:phosphoenolpyruvate carboxylase
MIKNRKLLEKLEMELIEKEEIDIEENFRIFEELLRFAKDMKRFSQDDWERDIENDIRYAKVINAVKNLNQKNSKRVQEKQN